MQTATVSVYYSEIVRVRAGGPEKQRKVEQRHEVEYPTLDALKAKVKQLAEERHRETNRGVMAQTFLWTDDDHGTIHMSYEID